MDLRHDSLAYLGMQIPICRILYVGYHEGGEQANSISTKRRQGERLLPQRLGRDFRGDDPRLLKVGLARLFRLALIRGAYHRGPRACKDGDPDDIRGYKEIC
jgi:hypothetical protein